MTSKGLVYNGFDFSPYLRCNPRRPLVPPTSVTTDELPGRDGTRFREARLGELKIPVGVELRARTGDDIAELRHRLAGHLWSAEPAPLFLGDDPFRYHLAVLDGESELDVLWKTGQTELTFRAPDPVMYGADREAALSGTAEVWVGGNHATTPVVEVVPQGTSLRVEHVGLGKAVEVEAEGSFDGTKTLLIDCGAEHCELGGVNADARVTLESDFFDLEPGENVIRVTGGTGTVRWTERWL